MEKMNFPKWQIDILKSYYDEDTIVCEIGGVMSGNHVVRRGLKQGCISFQYQYLRPQYQAELSRIRSNSHIQNQNKPHTIRRWHHSDINYLGGTYHPHQHTAELEQGLQDETLTREEQNC